MTSLFYTLGQGQAARQIEANTSNGQAEYVLRGEEVFAVFTTEDDDRIEVLQECPTAEEIKLIAHAKFNFSPKRVTPKLVKDFQLGYSSVLIAHIADTVAADCQSTDDCDGCDICETDED